MNDTHYNLCLTEQAQTEVRGTPCSECGADSECYAQFDDGQWLCATCSDTNEYLQRLDAMGMPKPVQHLTLARKVVENPEIGGDDQRFQVMEHLNNAVDSLDSYEEHDEEIMSLTVRAQAAELQKLAGIT